MNNNFEFRGINVLLLKKIAEYAKLLDPNSTWSIARISNVLIGSHESASSSSRWLLDSIFNIDNCITNKERNSLINILKENHTIIPHPLLNVTYDQVVGEKANIFVSFAYDSDFFELVDSIEQYFINNPSLNQDTTYFWIDMLVNNQWKADVKGFDWWTSTFKNAIGEIGSVLLYMSDWYKGPLQRAWCIFDLYFTAINKCKFEVIMSEFNQKKFLDNILDDPTNEINKMLSVIKSKDSTCWSEEDRIKIQAIIEEVIGLKAIDTMIFEQLREWAIQTTLYLFNNEMDEIKKLKIMNCLAVLYDNQGKYEKAEPLYVECLDKSKTLLGDDHPRTLDSKNNLAHLFETQGKHDLAEPLYMECLNKRKTILGGDHPDTLISMRNLAYLFENQGKHDLAEPFFVDCLEKSKAILGEDHPDTLISIRNLAHLFESHGKYDLAEPLYLECLEKMKIILGGDHPDTLILMRNLAHLFESQGKYDLAEPLYLECLEKMKIILGEDHPDTLISMNNLAHLFETQKK